MGGVLGFENGVGIDLLVWGSADYGVTRIFHQSYTQQ